MIARSYNTYCIEFLQSGGTYCKDCKRYNTDMNSNIAINLLTNIRKHLRNYKLMKKSLGSINDDRIAILSDAETLVSNYLRDKFRIKEIVDIDDQPIMAKPSLKHSAIQDAAIIEKSVKKRYDDDDDDYKGYYGAIII